MRGTMMAMVVAFGTLALPATAQEQTGYRAIAAGDLATAEATLQGERAIFPQRPELMVNLAAVYARTGRPAEARALYADVLARESVDLELGNGEVMSSHDLAHRGLSRLDTTIAAR